MFGEPVHHIGMVAGDAALVPFSMADEHTVLCMIKVILPAKIGTKFCGFLGKEYEFDTKCTR